MRGVTEWLTSIGLSEYAQRFGENGIDLFVLRDLTEQDLKELGVLIGHRRKLLRAIAELEDAAKPKPAEATTEPRRPDGERRHLTIMFCDLVGSAAIAARLDPEDMRALIGAYHGCIAEVINRYNGKVARYMGDGALVYFGFPQAHEDDAEQAVRAALALIDAVASIRNVAETLQIRIGIATGTVVVAELLIERTLAEHEVVGETPNLAARLQAMAEPGTVLICASTRRLAQRKFYYRDLGPVALKGWTKPFQVYQVLGTSGVESRFEAMHTAKLPPLFGREEEIELLLRRWRQATLGGGRVVVLTGEPGIGKSHIALALDERIQDESHLTLRYFCSEHHTHSALFPFINQLERASGFVRGDSPQEKLSKLDALLAQSTHNPEHLAVLANLLALQIDDHYRLREVTPQKRKEKTFAALLAQLDGLAAQQPVFLIFEDVHWIDPTSLELVAAAVEQAPRLRVLMLITARPEFTPPWPSYPHTTTIPLSRLGRRDGAALVLRVTGGKTLPKEVMNHILAHTDGVPLFIEELTKMVIEGGLLREQDGEYVLDGPLPSFAIPTTLQASLMARLDRLSPVRDVAQISAVAGREFHYELVNAVAGLPKQRLDEALDQLVRSELVFCRGEIPNAVYTFKHALVRDAAYAGLLKSRRVYLHAAIANGLEQRFPEIVQTQPEIIAYHYSQAKNYERALHYWYEAGKQSAARSAHNEAIGHLKHGLDQVPNIDEPMLRNKSELLLQISLGNSLRAIKGWSTDSVKHAYTRALQLCKESGLDEHILPAVFGLWTWNFVRASLGEAQALAEYLLKSAEDADNSVYNVLAREALGFTLFAQGRFAAAHTELERSISLCEDCKAAAYLELSAQDPRVHARSYDSMVLWVLGYPDQALRLCAEARRYADASQHPFSEAIARTIGLRVHQLRGDAAVVADEANATIAFCEEHEFVHYLAMALILRGWASADQGEFEKGIAEIQEGLEKKRATGALLLESYALGLMADACIKNRRYEQAFDALKQAQSSLSGENCERFYAAEIYRLLGETHLKSNKNLDQAEHYFCKGLEVAREQKAISFELRLCLSLCDLYELRPDADRCRSQLDELYRSFGEGFDTPDLVKAKARLESSW
ncbi:adenylate/guanylate cyclase domain-containing protein [Bradyrhizobium sp. CB3481]|uniref:adenylate/guanylate cyclase domain-containing protein n=1 Tax=Bradyrhizobium sp. CB3481 TaxID=3039158 RepID=UPI0024B08A9A|nr:adenylate/guanylate cyclase domain-containing protein [Bradyrhizobium sp. CB3481]WFU16013.1 adenylate/guanylate cyclase domain-containing protein [Bradyrhizobium sp. CB3481]